MILRIALDLKLLNNAVSLQVDISKGFIIGGESAGASLVASVTHLIRDDPFFEGKQPTGQILQIPVTIDPRAYPEKSVQYSLESIVPCLISMPGTNRSCGQCT